MERVIVTVKRADRDSTRDLELPADMLLDQLVAFVAQALRWPLNPGDPLGGYTLEARPPGRTLRPDETLADARVWDGAWLVFHPDDSTAGDSRFATPVPGPGPGWRRVDAPQPSVEPPPKRPAGPAGGFAWKRLDEEQ